MNHDAVLFRKAHDCFEQIFGFGRLKGQCLHIILEGKFIAFPKGLIDVFCFVDRYSDQPCAYMLLAVKFFFGCVILDERILNDIFCVLCIFAYIECHSEQVVLV